MKKWAVLLLLICLIAALCGCDVIPAANSEASTTAAPPRPMPIPTADRLELDGSVLGPVLALEGQRYVTLGTLKAAPGLTAAEPEPGVLALSFEETSLRLCDGETEAETGGGKEALGAPVLRDGNDWYLPLALLERLGGRATVYDRGEGLYRCLPLEEGPTFRLNGGEATESLLWGGVPMLPAEALAELLGCETALGTEPDGSDALTLRAEGPELRFREGAVEAVCSGAAEALPAPALIRDGSWYLPAAFTAEALGGVELETEAGPELWRPESGPALWLDGVELESLRFGDTLCAELSAMAEAAGGTAEAEADELKITIGEHNLVFRSGASDYSLDGTAKRLPLPVLCLGEARYAPISDFVGLLELPAPEGEALVYSRMEPRETLLWIDGAETAAFGLPDGPLYVRVGDLGEPVPEEEPVGNQGVYTVRGAELRFEGGSGLLMVDEAETELSAPAYGDGENWYLPAADTLAALGLTELVDPELDQIYYTHIVKHDSLEEGYRVPVLMYHAVSDYLWGIPELFISPSKLETQLQAIIEGGYTPITFEDLDRIAEIEKPVMLTFDDGYDDNYTELFPLLQKYNVKATVFVIVNDLGKSHKLTKAQVKEMSDSGLVSIQSHTMSHNYLTGMYEKQLRYEHGDSMLALARITGKQPFVMCYPTGKNSYYSRSITAEYYEYGLCMGGPCYVTGGDPYYICRYYIPRNTSLDTFLSYLDG